MRLIRWVNALIYGVILIQVPIQCCTWGLWGEKISSHSEAVEQHDPTLLPFSCPHQESDKAVPVLLMLLCSIQMF